jgi:S-formylglutathione hydrolase FrmB
LLVLAAALGLALPATAHGAQVVTWVTKSSFVDPAQVRFNNPPPGAPARPNALRVNVFLPDGYDGRERFPVLYLLHGHGDAYDHWANPQRGDLVRVAEGLRAVVVMPEGASGWYANWWNGGQRASPAWERYHLDELIPLVEERLRIRPGRRFHAIAGFSIGGLGALYYASQRPGYFGTAAAFQGTVSIQRPEWPQAFDTQGEDHREVYGDPVAQRFYWSGHNPTAMVENLRHTRVYIAVGDGTPLDLGNPLSSISEAYLKFHSEDFVAAARAAGVSVTYAPQAGTHDWPYRRKHLGDAIRWGLFEEVPESPDRWTYETVAQTGAAWALDLDFESPPEEVATFSREGDTLRASGASRVRVTTGDGCSFAAELPFERTLPGAAWTRITPRLRLTVRPRSLRARRPTRLRFRVTATRCGRSEPTPAAIVRLAGRSRRTDRRGRASLRLRRPHAGRLRVEASKPGYDGGAATVRVR